MTGEEEGSGVMPMYNYMRLVPAAAAQSDCSTSSPNFTGLARLLDYISQVRFLHTGVAAKHLYNSSMGTTPEPSSSSLVKRLAHQTMICYERN